MSVVRLASFQPFTPYPPAPIEAPVSAWCLLTTAHWQAIEAYVALNDIEKLPPGSASILHFEVTRLVYGAVKAAEMCVDEDAVPGFPKQTARIIVACRPVRVLLIPAARWAPVASC